MKPELQKQLYDKYPKIFKQKDYSIKESCMPWGIETADGWYDLIDILCGLLQWDIDKNGEPQIEAVQVKEKYGLLRFYTNGETPKQSGYINFAEYISGNICEKCGSNKNVKQTEGWIVTLCEDCMKERNNV